MNYELNRWLTFCHFSTANLLLLYAYFCYPKNYKNNRDLSPTLKLKVKINQSYLFDKYFLSASTEKPPMTLGRRKNGNRLSWLLISEEGLLITSTLECFSSEQSPLSDSLLNLFIFWASFVRNLTLTRLESMFLLLFGIFTQKESLRYIP